GDARIDSNHNASTSASTYSSEKSKRALFFDEESDRFAFWKTTLYSHIMGIDVDLWDIVEENIQFQNMDADGVISSANRKALMNEENELYKKHHKAKSILVNSISYLEYLKISDKSSAKSLWDFMCSTYGKKIQDDVLEELSEEE
ncbi:aspartyl-tRNA synthetase, partial [Trifolium medium]|nr:aspartyl-tRNA synthetase [Trifolium medium]